MPEGDTVWQTAIRLRDALLGRSLTRSDVRVPRYATVDLSGQQVDEIVSRGKHLFIRVGPASVHSHLKMEGRWQVVSQPPRNDHRIRIILSAGNIHAVGVNLGLLEVLDREHDMEKVSHLGPDLLGEDWDPATAAANLVREPARAVAETLLDQRVMAGVGNVYANELCFVFGHLPTARISAVQDPQRLVSRAHEMLLANRSRPHRVTTGDRRPGRELWVYGRNGRPCRRCGTLIESDTGGERVAYWCPSCQR